MSVFKDVDLQGGLLAGLVSLVGVLATLLGLRAHSKVKTANAEESRQSRYEERRDAELAESKEKVDALQEALLLERELSSRLRQRLSDSTVALNNSLDELRDSNPKAAQAIQRWVRDSTMAAFDDKPAPPVPRLSRNRR